MIATVSRDTDGADFGAVSEKRKLVLATFDLCAVCGSPFGAELRWQVAFNESHVRAKTPVFSEAPVHEICGLYAAQVCPFVGSPYARFGDQQRKGLRRPEVVVLAGYRRTSDVRGFESGLQRGTAVLHFEMNDLAATHVLRTRDEAEQAYAHALECEPTLQIDPEERTLTDLVSRWEDEEDRGGVLAGAAWMIGAAFCPGIDKVQGMKFYVEEPFYHRCAVSVLGEPRFAEDMADSPDEATRAAMNWLNTRVHLPAELERWRRRGRNRIRSIRSGSTSNGNRSPSEQKKSKRKAQNASRRKNR
ncbi:hypothetical protein [Nocardia alni]|uniref:hypothetical protein n=1 Tax=Nocardia alni TaxID=2815723 RepID=UPI001C22638F|nr:hypothetical protein [Nocardia alni]